MWRHTLGHTPPADRHTPSVAIQTPSRWILIMTLRLSHNLLDGSLFSILKIFPFSRLLIPIFLPNYNFYDIFKISKLKTQKSERERDRKTPKILFDALDHQLTLSSKFDIHFFEKECWIKKVKRIPQNIVVCLFGVEMFVLPSA